ncbi:hypothetical protein GCM10009416_14390 [Craurococcus roseus]|uniref:Uncharacterized protein n=1 Tax=Craurococcus roseus TaxID=77585 RepID=A0ABN1EYF6_9PROT
MPTVAYPSAIFHADPPDLSADWLAWPAYSFDLTREEVFAIAAHGVAFLDASGAPGGPDQEGFVDALEAGGDGARAAWGRAAAAKLARMDADTYGRLVAWIEGFAHGCGASRP